jgi:putative flippase GtrA
LEDNAMNYPLAIRRHSKELSRFARFAIVGGIGTLLDFGMLILLNEFLSLPVLLANTLAYLTGLLNNFTLNRLWTYPDARRKPLPVQFGQFFIVSLVGLLLNDGLVWLL